MLGGGYGGAPLRKTHFITADEVHCGVLDRTLKERGFAYFCFRDDAVQGRGADLLAVGKCGGTGIDEIHMQKDGPLLFGSLFCYREAS
jgi:hypothetical protein